MQVIKQRWIKTVLVVIAVSLVAFSMVWLETLHRAKESFLEAEKAKEKGDYALAIVWYGTTIRFYTPGSKWVTLSKNRLFDMGQMFEASGDYKKAKESYDEVVHGIYAIRSFYTPHKDWQDAAIKKVEECKKKIK